MTLNIKIDLNIQAIVKDVDRLKSAGGSDSAALLRIRNIVANELIGGGSLDIIAGALGQMKSDSAVNQLLEIVDYCVEHFIVENRMLSVIVLPVSIRARGVADLPIRISKGGRGPLKELAEKMTAALGACNVTIDNRLFTADSISNINVRKLRAHVLKLAEGAAFPSSDLSALQIYAESDARWSLAYFIGVEVIEAMGSPKLHDSLVQMQSTRWRDCPGNAIEMSDEVNFHDSAQVQVVSHGVFYLMRGLDAGVMGQRSMEMVDMLESMGTNARGLKIYCALDSDGSKVRTFMVSPVMALQKEWSLLGQESLSDFQRCLAKLAYKVLSGFDHRCISIVDSETYSVIIRRIVPDFWNPRKLN